MKFWFVYRTPTPERWIFYNWDKNNLRYCYDPVEAEEWYNKFKDDFKEIKLARPWALTVKVSLPFREEGKGTHNLELWANGMKRIDARMLAYIDTFSKLYLITEEWYFVENNLIEIDADHNMSALQMMKDVLLWVIRITPIKIFTWLDKKTKERVYANFELWQDFDIEYTVNGKSYKTKVFWAYAGSIRDAVGDDMFKFDGGYNMQAWQRHYNFYRAQITAIHACRGSGKTISETPDSIVYAFKEETYDYERINGIVQHFFSLTNAAVKHWPLKYVKRAMNKIFKNTEKKARKYDRHDNKFYLFDWDEYSDGGDKERSIMMLSVGSDDKGRWQRPAKSKFDEAAWYDDSNGSEAFGIALGTNYNEITLLTTINYENWKNWEYDVYMKCRSEMKNNEDLPTLIHRLWVKYWFDKCESREDYARMIKDGTFKRAREEFHSRYKYAALKYTIDEVDEKVIAKEKKEEMVKLALQKGEQFMLAEYYSEYIDSYPEFISSWLVDATTPQKFDTVIVWFDEWGWFDNPACVVWWVVNNKVYIKYSERLPKEPREKWDAVRNCLEMAKRWSPNWRVRFVCSATGGNAYSAYKDAYEATWYVDMLIKETKAGDDSWKEFYFVPAWNGLPAHHRIGKKYMVKITRDSFFNKGNIVLDASLEWDKWLLDELENYKCINWIYKAAKGKDDQVAAMMFVVIYAYEMVLKDSYRKEDLAWENQYEQFIWNWKWVKEQAQKDKEVVGMNTYANYRL